MRVCVCVVFVLDDGVAPVRNVLASLTLLGVYVSSRGGKRE